MALEAQLQQKARQITDQVADQYVDMFATMNKLSTDTAGRITTIQTALDWDVLHPGYLTPQVVLEAQQFLAYMNTLATLLATAPPVPNI